MHRTWMSISPLLLMSLLGCKSRDGSNLKDDDVDLTGAEVRVQPVDAQGLVASLYLANALPSDPAEKTNAETTSDSVDSGNQVDTETARQPDRQLPCSSERRPDSREASLTCKAGTIVFSSLVPYPEQEGSGFLRYANRNGKSRPLDCVLTFVEKHEEEKEKDGSQLLELMTCASGFEAGS